MSVELKNFLSLFKDTKKAYRTVLTITSTYGLLRELSDSMDSLYTCLKNVCNRDTAFTYFEQFIANSTMKSTVFELLKCFPVVREVLFGILSQSSTLSRFLILNPESLFWLIEESTLGHNKCKENYIAEARNFLSITKDTNKKEYLLRIFRKREYLRIAAREIIKACPFEQTMKELSELAKAILEVSIDIAYEKLSHRYRKADRNICIIGMGKLGSGELNFSSDIDILFVHKDPQKSDFYNKLASSIISIISSDKEGGYVFRVDTELRPGGKYYPLSMSIEEYEYYYNTFGQTWEKMALLRASLAAGSLDLYREFRSVIDGFIYAPPVDETYIDEIRSLMFRIKKHSHHMEGTNLIPREKIDVKKGEGGIREVEFIVHYLQLIYGKEYKTLRYGSICELINKLSTLNLMDTKTANKLKTSYLFLRLVEHKLQLKDERQTQTLPTTEEELDMLGCIMKSRNFIKEYIDVTDYVHSVFRDMFIGKSNLPVFGFEEDIEGYLKEKGIQNANQIAHNIVTISRKWNAEKLNRATLTSLMNSIVSATPNNNLLSNAISGLSKIPLSYLSSIHSSPALEKLLIKLLSVGYGNIISEHPFLMEELFLMDKEISYSETSKPEKIRLEFAIILRTLALGFEKRYMETLSSFAENAIKDSLSENNLTSLTVLALGKLGIKEIFKGSDLDLVFLSEDPYKVNLSRLRKFMANLKKMYELDLRLRPFGDKGPLIVSVNYMGNYFRLHARTWEYLAYQKSRIVAGETKNVSKLLNEALYKELSKKDIKAMKLKIEKNKAQSLSIKSSPGGITDIEFIAQYLAFKHGVTSLGTSAIGLLNVLGDCHTIESETKQLLIEAYEFYTSILSCTRIFSDSPYLSEEDIEILEYLTGKSNVRHALLSRMKSVKEIFEEVFS